MKRISQNKFASSLFSCLGVAACVAFSSCGKKDNDQFKNANEFAEFLKSKANNENIDLGESNLETFAKANWKTASKKTFQFTEAIKKQIAGEDLDNEDEELHDPEQQTPKQTNPEQQNPGTEQQKPEQPNPGTEHPKPTTTDPSGTTTISDESKLSGLIKTEDGKHVGVKIGEQYFDLNVFFDLYSWIYNMSSTKEGLVKPDELTWKNVKTIVTQSMFKKEESKPSNEEKKFGIKDTDSKDWKEEDNIYTYVFTASSKDEDYKKLECPCYNGLLKFWAQDNDLGFSEKCFDKGQLKSSGVTLEKKEEVAKKLAGYLKEN